MKRILLGVFVLGFLICAQAFAAGIPAYEWSTDTVQSTDGSWVFGIDFQVNGSNISVSGLGYYDDNGNGFIDNHEVGMYDSVGNLLASGVVTSADSLIGHSRYIAISPIVLLAGQVYRVVGVSHSDNYTWDPLGFSVDPSITYLGDTYQVGTTLVDPAPDFVNDATHGYFGPDFLIGSSESVPEPSTFVILASGLAGLVAFRRKR